MGISEILSDESLSDIRKHGCCLGKYRVLMNGVYYCYLGGVFDCQHQERTSMAEIRADMFICETERQTSCQTCEQYKAVATAQLA